MTVRTALALINQTLDEVLSEQEGDFNADTRFCVKWRVVCGRPSYGLPLPSISKAAQGRHD